MQVCFIGHRTIDKTEQLISSLKEAIINLINKGVTKFLFGSVGEFNSLALEIVTQLKKIYPFIKRVYVRANYPNIEKFYEEYLLKFYEETYFPPKLQNAGKYSYVERNYYMIDSSNYCIFYCDKKYVPPLKQACKQNTLLSQKRNSGTNIAYDYAIKKRKEIINLYP